MMPALAFFAYFLMLPIYVFYKFTKIRYNVDTKRYCVSCRFLVRQRGQI